MARISIIKMDVNVTSLKEVIEKTCFWVKEKRGRYICVANVHMCMETFDSEVFKSVVNQADLVIPDGKPLSVAQKLLGWPFAKQVRGQDAMQALCSISGNESINVGLYGGASDTVLEKVKTQLKTSYPDIRLTFDYSPPFRELTSMEDNSVVTAINEAKVNILFVGIGCPKQEIWMREHKEHLNCVMLGVGAAFDFIAGNKKYAPRWVQKIGMEWFFRLLSEPKRLWKRYLKQNPRFVWYFLQQWLFKKNF